MAQRPIGVFDSGYGGLTILSEIVKNFRSTIISISATMPGLLMEPVASTPFMPIRCNVWNGFSARVASWSSWHAIQHLPKRSERYSKTTCQGSARTKSAGRYPANLRSHWGYTQTGHVGVMGTTGTVASGSYLIEIAKFFPWLPGRTGGLPDVGSPDREQ